MSLDPVTPFIEPISTLIDRLTKSDISLHKNITINYRDHQILYDLQLVLGDDLSRREKMAEKFSSHFKESFKMERVIDFHSLLVPSDQNLTAEGVAKLSDGKFELDIGRLIREYRFDIASLRITSKIPDNVLAHWIGVTRSSTGIREGNRIKGRMELSIDYGTAWYGKYDRFEVKDVEYDHTIIINPSTIGEIIPRDFYAKIMAAARAYHVGNANGLKFFSSLDSNFLLFEDDRYYDRIMDTVSVDSDGFEILGVTPKMSRRDILPGGPQILLPGSYRIRFKGGVEGKDVVKKSIFFVDIDKLKTIFADFISLTNMQIRGLRFD